MKGFMYDFIRKEHIIGMDKDIDVYTWQNKAKKIMIC